MFDPGELRAAMYESLPLLPTLQALRGLVRAPGT